MPQPVRKRNRTHRKAAAPKQGAAAFFCSTGKRKRKANTMKKLPLHQNDGKYGAMDNLLSYSHYFHRTLAKQAMPVAVIAKGQVPDKLREVWI